MTSFRAIYDFHNPLSANDITAVDEQLKLWQSVVTQKRFWDFSDNALYQNRSINHILDLL